MRKLGGNIEVGRGKAESRRQMTDDGKQRAEDRGHRVEGVKMGRREGEKFGSWEAQKM